MSKLPNVIGFQKSTSKGPCLIYSLAIQKIVHMHKQLIGKYAIFPAIPPLNLAHIAIKIPEAIITDKQTLDHMDMPSFPHRAFFPFITTSYIKYASVNPNINFR